MKQEETGYTYLYTIGKEKDIPVKLIANKLRNVFHITILSQPHIKPFKILHDGNDWVTEDNICDTSAKLIPYIQRMASRLKDKSVN